MKITEANNQTHIIHLDSAFDETSFINCTCANLMSFPLKIEMIGEDLLFPIKVHIETDITHPRYNMGLLDKLNKLQEKAKRMTRICYLGIFKQQRIYNDQDYANFLDLTFEWSNYLQDEVLHFKVAEDDLTYIVKKKMRDICFAYFREIRSIMADQEIEGDDSYIQPDIDRYGYDIYDGYYNYYAEDGSFESLYYLNEGETYSEYIAPRLFQGRTLYQIFGPRRNVENDDDDEEDDDLNFPNVEVPDIELPDIGELNN